MPTSPLSLSQKFKAHQSAIYALHHNAGEDTFFTAGGDGDVVLWTLAAEPVGKVIAKVPSTLFSILHLPKTNTLLAGQMIGGLHVIDLVSKTEVKHLAFHKKGIFSILLVGEKLILAGGDGVVSFWSVKDFSPLGSIKASENSVRALAFNPKNNELAIGTSDNTILIFDLQENMIKKTLSAHKNSVFSLAYSLDGLFLLSGSRDAHLAVFNVQNNYSLEHYIPAHNYAINDIAYHESGKVFATASRDKSIKIWNAADFSFIQKLDLTVGGHKNSVNKIFWHGNKLISCSDDQSVIVWEQKK